MVFLFSLSTWLEACCLSHASSTISGVMQLQPDTAFCTRRQACLPISQVGLLAYYYSSAGGYSYLLAN